MEFLEKPTLGVSTLQIFLECVEGYVGTPTMKDSVAAAKAKRERLKQFSQAVELSAMQYDSCIPQTSFTEPPIPTEVSSKENRFELQKVYEEKFVPEGEPGRDYFEVIRRSKECGRCPICGGTGITQLDHYLPNSTYPTLCVHPNNLIPICNSCNTIKRNKENAPGDGMPLHLYFDRDRIPRKERRGRKYIEAYLFAQVDDDFQVQFEVRCPSHWNSEWDHRIKAHMKMYELPQRYSARVYTEYAKILSTWDTLVDDYLEEIVAAKGMSLDAFQEILTATDLDRARREVFHEVIQAGERSERSNLNSWKSALYRALLLREADLAAWLTSNKDHVETIAEKYKANAKKQREEAARILAEV